MAVIIYKLHCVFGGNQQNERYKHHQESHLKKSCNIVIPFFFLLNLPTFHNMAKKKANSNKKEEGK